METQTTAAPNGDSSLSDLLSDSQTLMSDENLAQELQLQEALFSSFTPPPNPAPEAAESSEMAAKRPRISSPPLTLCEICAERKGEGEMFPLHCAHSFCTCCISRHVSIVIGERRAPAAIGCPGIDCDAVLEMETLRAMLPADVVGAWDDALCESLISPAMKYYCPYKDCSGLLVRESSEGIREAECPFCHRLFCAKCDVAWHAGVDCDERDRVKEGEEREREHELKLHDLAKGKKWQRCPNCRFYVDRRNGCLHMSCRCGFEFCYGCGKAWHNGNCGG